VLQVRASREHVHLPLSSRSCSRRGPGRVVPGGLLETRAEGVEHHARAFSAKFAPLQTRVLADKLSEADAVVTTFRTVHAERAHWACMVARKGFKETAARRPLIRASRTGRPLRRHAGKGGITHRGFRQVLLRIEAARGEDREPAHAQGHDPRPMWRSTSPTRSPSFACALRWRWRCRSLSWRSSPWRFRLDTPRFREAHGNLLLAYSCTALYTKQHFCPSSRRGTEQEKDAGGWLGCGPCTGAMIVIIAVALYKQLYGLRGSPRGGNPPPPSVKSVRRGG